jgi:hypothetical protein
MMSNRVAVRDGGSVAEEGGAGFDPRRLRSVRRDREDQSIRMIVLEDVNVPAVNFAK